MGKKKPPPPPPEQPRNTGNEFHVHRFYSTKPGHKFLRSEACNCSNGKDHASFESP